METFTLPEDAGPPPPTTSDTALASALSGGAAWVFGALPTCGGAFFPPLLVCTGLIFIAGSIAAVVLAARARTQIAASDGRLEGASLATFGAIAGWGGIGLSVLLLCAGVGMFLLSIAGAITLPGLGGLS